MCHGSTNLHLNNQRSRKNCIPRSINRNSHWTINGKVIEYAKLSQKVAQNIKFSILLSDSIRQL